MTETEKLEIVNEALLHDISRFKTDNYLLKNDLNKAGEKISALLEVERNLSSKVRELQTKNEGLELDLASLHETLEKTESELAKAKNERDKYYDQVLVLKAGCESLNVKAFVCHTCKRDFDSSEVKLVGEVYYCQECFDVMLSRGA